MKRRTRYFSLLLLCVLATACQEPKIPKDKYFEGLVILRAEKNSPLGLIKLTNVYSRSKLKVDPHMDEPRKAVVYQYKDQTDQFDLGEKVYLSIGQKNGVQIACNILPARGTSNVELFDISEKYQYIQHIEMNLHNADDHREGPKHKKVYTNFGVALEPVDGYPIGKIYVSILDAPTGSGSAMDSFYVELSANIEADSIYYTQFSKRIGIYDVHSFELEHIH